MSFDQGLSFEEKMRRAEEEGKILQKYNDDYFNKKIELEYLQWFNEITSNVGRYNTELSNVKRTRNLGGIISSLYSAVYLILRPGMGLTYPSGVDLALLAPLPLVSIGLYISAKGSLKEAERLLKEKVGEENLKEKIKQIEEAEI